MARWCLKEGNIHTLFSLLNVFCLCVTTGQCSSGADDFGVFEFLFRHSGALLAMTACRGQEKDTQNNMQAVGNGTGQVAILIGSLFPVIEHCIIRATENS
jgi:hypothetical protein